MAKWQHIGFGTGNKKLDGCTYVVCFYIQVDSETGGFSIRTRSSYRMNEHWESAPHPFSSTLRFVPGTWPQGYCVCMYLCTPYSVWMAPYVCTSKCKADGWLRKHNNVPLPTLFHDRTGDVIRLLVVKRSMKQFLTVRVCDVGNDGDKRDGVRFGGTR